MEETTNTPGQGGEKMRVTSEEKANDYVPMHDCQGWKM